MVQTSLVSDCQNMHITAEQCLLIVFLAASLSGDGVDALQDSKSNQSTSNRNSKLFPIFSIVSFVNGGCRSGSGLNGTCFTASECSNKGGVKSGNCASGFGVCCIFTLTNGGTVSQNCTYIQNPGFPSSYGSTSAINYMVTKSSSDVCLLRLDFDTFTILGPTDSIVNFPVVAGANAETLGGSCLDVFKVTGSAGPAIPTICGQNTGQHIYVDVGGSTTDSATLAFTFGTPLTPIPTSLRKWNIKVTQIPCSSPVKPPNGCLQYFYSRSGRISTFNFQDSTGQHIGNQQYTACIRAEMGICCIQYQACADQTNSFSLSSGDMTIMMGFTDTKCTLDYIQIEGSSAQCTTSNTGLHSKYCGKYLTTDFTSVGTDNVPICDCTQPYQVGIFTNALSDVPMAGMVPVANTAQSRGVCLDYIQQPCGGI